MSSESFDGISPLNNSQSTLNKSDYQDINNLLFLETLQRNKEHEVNIRTQAEEKARLYEEAYAEYRCYFERYVRSYEAAMTRNTLENDSKVGKSQLDQLRSDTSTINREVTNDVSVGCFTPEVVEQCIQAIRALPNYDGISQIRDETINIKKAIDTIKSLNASIEQKLESVSTRSIDFYVEQLRSKYLEEQLSLESEL